ncbi:V-type ATP synthase subunit E [Clostridium tetani 12124569]|nr:V-type ATP synthase subunit E [Clostridium tetani 12124569]
MINEALESLKERIMDFTKSDEYTNYIKNHLDNTLKDIENKKGIIIYFNKKDLEKFKKIINKDNVEVSNESKDIIGGYIIQDKNNKFRVDCSLETSIEECKEKIGISITELFM